MSTRPNLQRSKHGRSRKLGDFHRAVRHHHFNRANRPVQTPAQSDVNENSPDNIEAVFVLFSWFL